MRYPVLNTFAFCVYVAMSLVAQAQAPISCQKTVQTDAITVAFTGRLSIVWRLKPDADPTTQFCELAARDLVIATVEAGGTTIHLDWSRSQKIVNELLYSSMDFGDGGPNPSVQAKVTGRMVFKPSKELAGRITPAGVTDDAPVPVVIVESIKIEFSGSNGKPRGLDRKLVTAD